LLEVLFGLVIVGLLMVQALQLKAANDKRVLARFKADNLAAFQRVASQYYLTNRQAMDAAMASGDPRSIRDHCRVYDQVPANLDTYEPPQAYDAMVVGGVSRGATCALDALWLKRRGVWPDNIRIEVDSGVRWVAIFKMFNEPSDVRDGSVEMLVVLAPFTNTAYNNVAVPHDQLPFLHTARDSLGATGGLLPKGDAIQCATQLAVGGKPERLEACGNGWAVQLTDFVSSSQLQVLRGRLAAP
jgi:type II secretory pathway pseudopilin PulG